MRHPFLNIALLFCMALTAAACSGNADETPASKKQTADEAVKKFTPASTLILGVMPSMDYLPLAVADKLGYFDAQGIRMELRTFYSANERDAALLSGNIDGAVTDFTGAVLLRAGGAPIRLTSRCDAPFYIVASKISGITELSGLKGAKVAVSRNTVIDYCMDMAARAARLKPEDLNKAEINKIPLRFEMLNSGQIDVTGLPDPMAIKAVEAGGRFLASNASLGFGITGIVFTEQTIQDKRNAVEKLYQAYDRGAAYIRVNNSMAGLTHPPLKDILTTDMGFPPELLHSYTLPEYSPAELPAEEDINKVAAWLRERGLLTVPFPASDLLLTISHEGPADGETAH